NEVDFSGSGWSSADDYGKFGTSPWATKAVGINNSTPARLIWTDSDDDLTVYFRRVIQVN
ncbi:MAG: hypothetical protein JKX97_00655, partial [Candidatus Lindowbacteria bacterium]|nr:hypothetical protein [Candidatus Lindowbacteria bacterium]